MRKKNVLSEGTWFAIPLKSLGYGIGLAARVSVKSGIILAYLFNEKKDDIPKIADVAVLKQSDAIMVIRMGTIGLSNGEWPIIGVANKWNRTDWPNKDFIRQDELAHRAWKIRYSDDDQNKIDNEVPVPYGQIDMLDKDTLYGDVAAAKTLTRRIYGLSTH